MPTNVTTELRGQQLEGIVTSADVIALQALFMNREEIQIFRNPASPDPFGAVDMMKQRQNATLKKLTKELGSEEAADKKISQEWLQKLVVNVECDVDVRNDVLRRLLEIYPTIPDTWIYWNPDRKLAGHRLEPQELLFDLITPALGKYTEENEDLLSDKTEESSAEDSTPNPAEPDFAAAQAKKGKAAGFTKERSLPPAEESPEDQATLDLVQQLNDMNPKQRQAAIKDIQSKIAESPTGLLEEVSS